MSRKDVQFEVATARYRPAEREVSRTNDMASTIIGQQPPASDLPPEDTTPQLPECPIILGEEGNSLDDDQIGVGHTVYEVLSGSAHIYNTSLPVDCMQFVWIDGLEAFPLEHYILERPTTIILSGSLISGTIVDARYTIAVA